ncbi:TPA: hypothetical protein ACQ0F8_002034 [Streptococcus agalactiae]|nr:hypothetical protein [Streptococcus agalactiae]HEO4177393.1 hypothetical protein [Streptococcus agalactiae]
MIRFIPIISFASLYNKENFQSISVEKVSDVFSLLQLLVVAFVPSFSLIQSYLFKYQTLFTDGKKRSSASNEKIYLIWGTVVTVAGLIILEVFKRKFGY